MLVTFSFSFPLAILKYSKIFNIFAETEIQGLQLGEYEVLSVQQTFIEDQPLPCTIPVSGFMRGTNTLSYGA